MQDTKEIELARWLDKLATGCGLTALGRVQNGVLTSGEGWCMSLDGDRLLDEKTDLLGRRTENREAFYTLRLRLVLMEGDPAGLETELGTLLNALIRTPPPAPVLRLLPEDRIHKTPGDDGLWEVRLGLRARYIQILEP